MSTTIAKGAPGRTSTNAGVLSTPTMTVRFKMDITTSGTNQGLFITTGIQAGGSQANAHPWGYFHAQQSYPSVEGGPATNRSVMAISPYSVPAIKDVTAPAGVTAVPDGTPRVESIKSIVDALSNEDKAAGKQFNIGEYLSGVGDPRPKSPAHSRPSSPLRGFVGRDSPPESFVQPSNFQLNLFSDGIPSTSTEIRKAPYVEHPTDYILNDTTTTTTTVEIFRARADEEDPVDFYQLPPEPFSTSGLPQLVRARGPAYEAETKTETQFAEVPPKSVQWDGESRRTQSALSSPWVSEARSDQRYYRSEEAQSSFEDEYTTIMRKQWNRRDEERLMDIDSASKYAGRPITPVITYPDSEPSRDRPPLPRKPRALHHTKSHQDIFATSGYEVPRISPRSAQDRHSRQSRYDYQTGSLPRPRSTSHRRDLSPSYEGDARYTRVPSRPSSRSASSNEIFRLYQTRDCLGNVLYELPIEEVLSIGYHDTPTLLSPMGEEFDDSAVDSLSPRDELEYVNTGVLRTPGHWPRQLSDNHDILPTEDILNAKDSLESSRGICSTLSSSGYTSWDREHSEDSAERGALDSLTRSNPDIPTDIKAQVGVRDTGEVRSPYCFYSEDSNYAEISLKSTVTDSRDGRLTPCFQCESPSFGTSLTYSSFLANSGGLPPIPPNSQYSRQTSGRSTKHFFTSGDAPPLLSRERDRAGNASVSSDSEPDFSLANITEPSPLRAVADHHRLLLIPEE